MCDPPDGSLHNADFAEVAACALCRVSPGVRLAWYRIRCDGTWPNELRNSLQAAQLDRCEPFTHTCRARPNQDHFSYTNTCMHTCVHTYTHLIKGIV